MYSIKRTIGSAHIGENGRLRYSAVVDFMQDCSGFHLETLKDLYEYLTEHRIAMFYVSRQVDILRLPEYGEDITLKTLVYDCKAMYGCRNTFIYDKNNEICVKSNTIGAFVNISNGRGYKMPESVIKKCVIKDKLPMEYLPRKIVVHEDAFVRSESVKISRSHIDKYNHVNNARYIDIAYDHVDITDVSRIRIEYKTPMTLKDIVIASSYKSEGISTVKLHNNRTVFAVVEFTSK